MKVELLKRIGKSVAILVGAGSLRLVLSNEIFVIEDQSEPTMSMIHLIFKFKIYCRQLETWINFSFTRRSPREFLTNVAEKPSPLPLRGTNAICGIVAAAEKVDHLPV